MNSKITKTLIDDLKSLYTHWRQKKLKRMLSQDFHDVQLFFLDEEKRNRLTEMGRVRRWLYIPFWLLKALILKLNSVRRALVFIGILLLILSRSTEAGNDVKPILGGLLLIFVLLLELKDKLLAKNELMAGRAVQMALMPDKQPMVPGWELWLYSRPANEVGGDLIDYFQINGSRYGVALGDVAGKGLSAALLMAKLQSTLRVLAPDSLSLDALGEKMNRIFCRDGLPDRFSSLIYFELGSNSPSLKLVNAGHFPPLIIRKTKIEELPKGQAALGIVAETQYREQQLELEQCDLLLAYTDGLTEARNEEGEFYGEERLFDFLKGIQKDSAGTLGARIVNEINRFVGDARTNDDLSMVILMKTNHEGLNRL